MIIVSVASPNLYPKRFGLTGPYPGGHGGPSLPVRVPGFDVSGEMVNIEDDECNPVSSSKTRWDRSYPRTIDEEPKNTFFGWAGKHSRGYVEAF